MDLRRLRYFVEVARSGSYRAAADRLHVAQPALWQQVHVLERELGLSLFRRSGRNVVPSQEGVELLEQAERLLAAAERLRAAADDLRAGRIGVVRLACYTPHLERYLAPIIGQFEREHPQVRVEIEEFAASGGGVSQLPASVASLLSGSADIAVGPRPPGDAQGFLIGESRLVAAVATGTALASLRSLDVASMREIDVLLLASRDSFSRSAFEAACHAAGFEPRVKLQSSSSSALVALAESDVGVAVLPDMVVPRSFGGVLVPLVAGGTLIRREVWLCWRPGALGSPSVAAFIDAARQRMNLT